MTEWPTLSSQAAPSRDLFHVSDVGLAWLIHQNPPNLVTQLISTAFLQSCALNLRQQLLKINVHMLVFVRMRELACTPANLLHRGLGGSIFELFLTFTKVNVSFSLPTHSRNDFTNDVFHPSEILIANLNDTVIRLGLA